MGKGADPVTAVAGQVRQRQLCAGLAGRRHDFVGECAAIKRFTVAFGDRFQGFGLFPKTEQLTGLRRPTVRQKPRECGEFAGVERLPKNFRRQRPRSGGNWRDQKAVARIADGSLEQPRERQFPEALRQRHPRAHAARHGYRIPAAQWHFTQPVEIRRRDQSRASARRIQPVQLARRPTRCKKHRRQYRCWSAPPRSR